MRQAHKSRRWLALSDKENDLRSNNLPAIKDAPLGTQHLKLNCKKHKKTFLNIYSINNNRTRLNPLRKPTIQSTRTHITQPSCLSSRTHNMVMSSRHNNTGEHKNESQMIGRHRISNHMRAKMVDWLLQICEAHQYTNQTFFLAVYLMDTYLLRTPQILQTRELHVIGVTCIFMASKYEEIQPMSAKVASEDIGHKKISTKEIVQREHEILECIQYSFKRDCAYIVCRQILNGKNIPQSIWETAGQLLKMAAYDPQLIRAPSGIELALGTIIAATRSTQLQQSTVVALAQNLKRQHAKYYEQGKQIAESLLILRSQMEFKVQKMKCLEKIIESLDQLGCIS